MNAENARSLADEFNSTSETVKAVLADIDIKVRSAASMGSYQLEFRPSNYSMNPQELAAVIEAMRKAGFTFRYMHETYHILSWAT